MDPAELSRLTSEFDEAVDEFNEAARRAGQTDPGAPLALRAGADPLRGRVRRVLALQEDIVAPLTLGADPLPSRESVTIGLVVARDEWQGSAVQQGRARVRARAALERAAARLGLVLVGEPRETVSDTFEGVVLTMTADGWRRP